MPPKFFYRLLALTGMILFVVTALLLSRGRVGTPPHEKSDDPVLTALFHEVFAREPSVQRDEMVVDLARAYVRCGNVRMGEYLLRRLQRKNASARSRVETILAGAYFDLGEDGRGDRLLQEILQKEMRLAQTPYRPDERPNLEIITLTWRMRTASFASWASPDIYLQQAMRRCTNNEQREEVWRAFRRGFDDCRTSGTLLHYHRSRSMSNVVFSAVEFYFLATSMSSASDAAWQITWIGRAEAFERDYGVSSVMTSHMTQQKEHFAQLLPEIDALPANVETPTAEDVETLGYYVQARYILGGIDAALDDAGKIKDRSARVYALCRLARELSPRPDKLEPESQRLLEEAGKILDTWKAEADTTGAKDGKTATDTVDADSPSDRARAEYLAVKVDYGAAVGEAAGLDPAAFEERMLRREIFLHGLTPENLRRIFERAGEQPTLEGRIETLRLFDADSGAP